MAVESLLTFLLRLYPPEYRAIFEGEMSVVAGQALEEHRRRGWISAVRFLFAEIAGMAAGASAQWIAKIAHPRAYGKCYRELVPAGAPRQAPHELVEAEARIKLIIDRMVKAIATHDFAGARRYSDEERAARQHLRWLREKWGVDKAES